MTEKSAISTAVAAMLVAMALCVLPARAQLVDTPQNLVKAWSEAYASRTGDPMARVYARDAHLWASLSNEPVVGIEGIKQHYTRTGQNVVERSATVTKMQTTSRKRLTTISGTMEIKSKLKDGTARSNQARFTMSVVRESRRQWAILNHHISLVPQAK